MPSLLRSSSLSSRLNFRLHTNSALSPTEYPGRPGFRHAFDCPLTVFGEYDDIVEIAENLSGRSWHPRQHPDDKDVTLTEYWHNQDTRLGPVLRVRFQNLYTVEDLAGDDAGILKAIAESAGWVIVYSIDDKESYARVTEFYRKLYLVHSWTYTPGLLFAMKTETSRRQVSIQDGKKLGIRMGVSMLEICPSLGYHVDAGMEDLMKRVMRIERKRSEAEAKAKGGPPSPTKLQKACRPNL